MPILDIVNYPHPALSTPAEAVTVFDEQLGTFIDDLAETMYAANGVGLAANQVAELLRVTVIDVAAPDEPPRLFELVNPEVVEGKGELTWEEGCLSFPELFEKIDRASWVRVRYQNRLGETLEIEGDALFAVALQHEIDHLDGVCFIDRLKPGTRKLALKRFEKIMARRRAEDLDA